MNKVLMAVDRLGVLGTKGPAVLTVVGRKSGQPRSTPVTPMVVEGRRYVVGGFPGADWVRNAQANPEATLGQGKHGEPVRLVEMSPEEARPLLRQFPTLVPTGIEFMKSAGLVTEGTPDEFEELAGRCAVFRIDTRE
ncbi:nitroreductase family deazaflavin-dependent oxidoreductase [Gordonia zhaorongruii]|nr:nitroreductase family deazaflavin-dependent oxidoreductase [Gordonia zhaorongruii]